VPQRCVWDPLSWLTSPFRHVTAKVQHILEQASAVSRPAGVDHQYSPSSCPSWVNGGHGHVMDGRASIKVIIICETPSCICHFLREQQRACDSRFRRSIDGLSSHCGQELSGDRTALDVVR
jgi:hypothetical protein